MIPHLQDLFAQVGDLVWSLVQQIVDGLSRDLVFFLAFRQILTLVDFASGSIIGNVEI